MDIMSEPKATRKFITSPALRSKLDFMPQQAKVSTKSSGWASGSTLLEL